MAITNASRIADFSSGIGTVGAGIQIDNTNHRVIVGNGNSTTLEVSGIVSATAFSGHLIGNVTGTSSTSTVATTAYGLSGTPNITVGTVIGNLTGNSTGLSGTPNITVGNIVGAALTLSGNLTVNGTQTIINTTNLEITDPLVGIGSGNTTDAQADGDGIQIYGATNKTLTYNDTKKGFETNVAWSPNETRTITGAEKVYRTSGNTVSLAYNSSSANIGYTTNPSADITLAVTGIPTSSDFDDYAITFAVITNSTGTARTCTNVTLNGVSKTIRWAGGSLSASITGVTTSTGHTIFSFTGINTVGSASTTANYQIFGTASGGFF